jgi:hypothetical protein
MCRYRGPEHRFNVTRGRPANNQPGPDSLSPPSSTGSRAWRVAAGSRVSQLMAVCIAVKMVDYRDASALDPWWFLGSGANVLVTGRHREPLDAFAATNPGHAFALSADVSVEAEVNRAVAETISRLDIVVSNAATIVPGELTDLSDEDWATRRAVNVDGFFYLANAALPHLERSGGHSLPCRACQDWRATGARRATTQRRGPSPTSYALWSGLGRAGSAHQRGSACAHQHRARTRNNRRSATPRPVREPGRPGPDRAAKRHRPSRAVSGQRRCRLHHRRRSPRRRRTLSVDRSSAPATSS